MKYSNERSVYKLGNFTIRLSFSPFSVDTPSKTLKKRSEFFSGVEWGDMVGKRIRRFSHPRFFGLKSDDGTQARATALDQAKEESFNLNKNRSRRPS